MFYIYYLILFHKTHFVNEETDVYRGQATCPSLHSKEVAELGLDRFVSAA